MVQRADEPSDDHAAALERAYALVESAQGEDSVAEVEAQAARLSEGPYGEAGDVAVLLHFARSLAARETGIDDAGHVRAMLEAAAAQGDRALLALALATNAVRRADARRVLDAPEAPASPLVHAVGLLDGADGPVVHRIAALIEVGCVAHALALWELALEHFDLAELAVRADRSGRWASTVRRQHVVITFNRVELILDWASAEETVGEWSAAADRATTGLRPGVAAVDGHWPASWVQLYHGHLHVLAAIAGAEPPTAEPPPSPYGTLAAAVRAAREGDAAAAARLAGGVVEALVPTVPRNTRLLAMRLAARHPGTPRAAIRYADELARLRWNDRLDRMTGMRQAIAVERRRREHEQLRRELLTDELTGLANRRGYRAYLDRLLDPQRDEEPAGYAVMAIDVDHFKAVNDRFGHDVGDLVLAALGHILSAHVRPIDLAARLGGDEFIVILAEVRAAVCELRAQAIIDAVRTHPWPDLAAGLAVSVSIGVHAGTAKELPGLLTGADRQLYHAKHHGRGRVSAGRPTR
jgi:diguanylate cyclase (GGDEF)-like protein